MVDRFFARSASDNTDEWPFWFVADRNRGALNVTAEVWDAMFPKSRAPGVTLVCPDLAKALASEANARGVAL